METTIDALLNRRVQVEQPKKGFRIAIDTILLAAAVKARVGERVLDLGCGVGGAMLALAARVHKLAIDGLEIQPELVELCQKNIQRNNLTETLQVIKGDVIHLPGEVLFLYDHVMINPPYHEADKHDASPDASKSIANTEAPAKSGHMSPLEMWVISAARCLKQSGIMVMIHRADRLDEILGYMKPMFGDVEILPLLPKVGEEAKRVVIRARKGEGATPIPCRPLALHRPSEGYTDETDAILKHAKPLEFVPEEVEE